MVTETTISSDNKINLVVIAIQSYNPEESDDLEEDKLAKTAPDISTHLLVKKGKKFAVIGSINWWLYAKCLDSDECGYIPSTHVAPLKSNLSREDELELSYGGELSPDVVNQDVDLKFFPAAPVEQDVLNQRSRDPLVPDTKQPFEIMKPCPEESANILSKITFWWLTGLIYTGYKRPLENNDLWALSKVNKSSSIVPKLAVKWTQEQDKYKCIRYPKDGSDVCNEEELNNTKHLETDKLKESEETVEFVPKKEDKKKSKKGPSLTKVLLSLFWKRLLLAALFKLIHDILMFVQPLMLDLLIRYTEDKNNPVGKWKGYAYVASIFVAAILHSLALHQYFQIMMTLGMNMRTCVMGMVYPKALRLNSKARTKSTAGEMVNLMSVDAQRLMDLMSYINTLWSGPFQITVALYFLYNTMGASILAGIGVMLLLMPFNFVAGKTARKLQVKTMAEKDKRLKLINEILSGIKVLKLYAWESSFMKKLMGLRKEELRHQRSTMYLQASFSFSYTCAPFLVSLATFAIYVLTGNELTANKAFVAIALFNILRFPLTMFPNIIMSFIHARVSITRLTAFLNLEELDPKTVQRSLPPQHASQAIHVEDCSIKWDLEDSMVLSDINLNITSGSLVAVVGQVGCGKSTLLSTLLGETEKVTGQVYVKGSVAYVPQQAWIQNATLRDNILFGRAHNSVRYKKTISACALQPDLDILPSGDMTEIGEKGINLSGGQKQRVNLARAVYFNADVYLLDDPLSAVDSHVGKHIFDKVIGPRGKLRNKTRILVTHSVNFLPQVDQIVVLQNGRISEVGTYAELQANQGAFAEFLETYSTEHKEDKEPEPERVRSSGSFIRLPEEDMLSMQRVNSFDCLAGSCEQLDGPVDSTGSTGNSIDTDSVDGREKKITQVTVEETSETGKVKVSLYFSYAKSLGIIVSIFLAFFLIAAQGSLVGSRIWLARWSSDNITTLQQVHLYLGVYGALGFSQALFVLISSLLIAFGSNIASRILHDNLLLNIMRSPMSFFESNPLGRIVNRFSKDMYVIDDTVPRSLSTFLQCFLAVIGALFGICFATPIFLVVILPLGGIYFFIQHLYVASSRQLKRIESVSRSPIYNNFLETINGASTIRAYSQQQRFVRENYLRVDGSQVAYYPWVSSNRWLAIRLEFLGNFVILFAALLAVINRNNIDSGMVGLSLTYAFQMTGTLNWLVRMSSELETNIVAVERVKEYSETPTEAEWIIEDSRPPDGWPDEGRIEVDSLDLRYRDNLPLVLKAISCDIQPGEKVGIVGRTGAGKSTLSLALFRMLENAGGKIVIDNIDISKIGLQDLRSRLTIIPQDPVLFSGTLRFNLDPFDKYTDDDLWQVLEVSHLKTFVSGLAEGLQHPVAEGGENLSVGQRQLVCLARALLRKSKVLVLDEATAAVDLETDELIQNTIRTEFAELTVLTIAHRLNTIMDYSRVIVMDKGFMVECDSPQNLLAQKGIFYGMAQDAGLA